MTLPELIKALEDATGPSRELDGAIALFEGWSFEKMKGDRQPYWRKPGETDYYMRSELIPYTKSVDAAIALCERLLPGSKWEITTTGFKIGCTIVIDGKFAGGAYAASPAIAACLAILRTKLSESDHG